MIGKNDHRDQRALLVYRQDELREDAVLTESHLGSGSLFSSLLVRNLLDNYIFIPSCCMPATVLASVDLSNVYSMQPSIIATQTIYSHRFSNIYISWSGRDGRGKDSV
jgi:hypothetical protein